MRAICENLHQGGFRESQAEIAPAEVRNLSLLHSGIQATRNGQVTIAFVLTLFTF